MYIFASQQFLVYGARIEPKNLVHCSVTLPDLLGLVTCVCIYGYWTKTQKN